MCPGVRVAHVLISAHSPKPTAKPIGIAVSGVLSVGQYVLEPIEKNAATLCGLDRCAPKPFCRKDSEGRFAAQMAARSMRRGRGRCAKHKPRFNRVATHRSQIWRAFADLTLFLRR